MKKSDRLIKRNPQQVCMTLTGDPELFFLGLQTLAELLEVAVLLVEVVSSVAAVLLVAPVSSVVAVLLVAPVSSVVAVLLVAPVSSVVAEPSVEVFAEFEQGPLKGSVFACVPFMTVFPRAGSKNAVLLFAGSWA
jgi:hypothetical protein